MRRETIPSKSRGLQTGVAVKPSRIPSLCIPQFVREALLVCLVKEPPRSKFPGMRAHTIDETSLFGTEPDRFEHMDAFGLASPQGRIKDWLQQLGTPLQGLEVN